MCAEESMLIYGYYYAGGLLAGAGIATWLAGWPYALPFYILAAFCLNFFRDPDREVPAGPVAVSPADGKVVTVRQDDAGGHRVSIFLNVFDVHVNRSPIAGVVSEVRYQRAYLSLL
jgi:phosphatidylserine decarboxylase